MIRKLALGLIAMAVFAAPAQAATLFGVDINNNLVTVDSNSPGSFQSTQAITGLGGASILAMDFRARDGKLYALADDKRLFTINKLTGAATLFASALPLTGTQFAFDFNPTNANLRIVGNDGQNGFYRFSDNSFVMQTAATYGGPPATGIIGAGYTNNFDGAMSTVLFVIDSNLDQLATLNVGTGALTNRGTLGADFLSRGSFDIDSASGGNSAFAYSGNTLYSINLAAGVVNNRATSLGTTSGPLFALTAAIPEPATWALMIMGFGLVGGAMRRRLRQRRGALATA